MKIYLIAGHQVVNGKGNGAFGIDGFDEALEARKLVQDIIRRLTFIEGVKTSDILTDNDGWSLKSVIGWLAKKVTRECITIDFHFNAFHTNKANGTEVLIANTHTNSERNFATRISEIISVTLGTKNRGVKTESQSQHPRLGMLSGGGAIAKNLLVEVCFITNEEDIRKYRNKYWVLVEKISDEIKVEMK